jgi:5'-nucleotidase/UDP-sugar diphosphatase
MKKAVAVFFLSLLIISPSGAQTGTNITILHTNDIHSRLTGYAPELSYTPLTTNDDKTVGGFARIATVLNNERKTDEGITLTVDAGDFLMGTLFQALEPVNGFQLRLMKSVGYDAVCLGNHEFDFGPGKLAEIINASACRGAIPPVLLSNAILSDKDTADDALGKLFSNNTVSRKLVINSDGLKIGFFSLLGVSAVENAAYATPVIFSKQIPTAKKLVKELRNEGCDIVICLSHSGVSAGKEGKWTGEDVKLARKVKGLDVIISGHTHTKLEKPIIINGVPIVQTGEYGQNVGKLDVTYNDGHITVNNYSLIPIDDRIPGDPSVNALIEEQKNVVEEQILKPLGMDYSKPLAESDFLLECNEKGDVAGSNLGPLVADAIQSYVNRHVKGGTDISMVAVGVIRDKIVPGLQTAPDIFRIMSMGTGNDNVPGYPLSKVYVTGHELKSILEILLLAGKSTPENYCYYSGFKADYEPGRGLLRKIKKVQIVHADGSTSDVDFSKKDKTLYSIVANSYMLEFVGIIRKMSKGLINVVPRDASGNPIKDMKTAVMDFDQNRDGIQEGKEWLAIIEYLSGMKDVNGNGVPDIDQKYKTAIQSFTVASGK